MEKNYFSYLIKICFSSALVISAGLATAQTTLYDNGPIFNRTGTGAGGANESMLETTTLGMGTIGFGAQQNAFNRIADDFTINDCRWKIDSIVFFSYQTNSTTSSTMTSVNFRIWDSIPDVAGSTIVYGDTTTNALTRTTWSGVYRITETTTGNTARPIMRNVCTVPGITLTNGSYWMDWSYAGSLASGPWAPPIVILNTAVTGNGKQRIGSVWNNALDIGTGTPAQGFPFVIYGSTPNNASAQTFVECAGFSVTVGTNTYNATGVYTDVLTNVAGCDSTVTTNLTIKQPSASSQTFEECAGFSVTVGTNTYNTSGVYTDVLTNVAGCDSTVTTNLTIKQPSASTQTFVECAGFSVAVGTNTYNTSGVYTDVLTNVAGCDSTVTTNLTINQPNTSSQTIVECAGFSITVGTNTYNATGVYTDVLTNVGGCDSTVTTNLTINQPTSSAQTFVECAGFSVTVGSNTYNASGVYTDVLTNVAGCDSTVTTNLTINTIDNTTSVSNETITANQVGATYQWIDCGNGNGALIGETNASFTATANGNYAVVLTQGLCSDTSACVTIASVGIKNAYSKNAISILPNPNNGSFTIKSATKGNYTLVNELGQTISLFELNEANNYSVSISELATGIYFVIAKDNSFRTKIVVTK